MARCFHIVPVLCFALSPVSVSLIVLGSAAEADAAPPSTPLPHASSNPSRLLALPARFFTHLNVSAWLGQPLILWNMAAFAAACGLWQALSWRNNRMLEDNKAKNSLLSKGRKSGDKSQDSDPGLLRKHSTIVSYTTSVATYSRVRTFYHPHPQADKLPTKPRPIPLLIFVHGLGGSLSQFNHLLTSLVNIAPCFGVDLPGCGRSGFSPKDWEAYSHNALVELLGVVIDHACELAQVEEVVLICHSMGCSLAASLVSETSPIKSSVRSKIIGLIAICPKVSLPSAEQVKKFEQLLRIPTPLFNIFRLWDRRGGVDSASVRRLVGHAASQETKKLQLRFNEQSRTEVWRRMAWGGIPHADEKGKLRGGLPGPEVWAGIELPIYAIAGQDDHVTPPEEISVISRAMGEASPSLNHIVSSGERANSQLSASKSSATTEKRLEHNEFDDRQRTESWGTSATTIVEDGLEEISVKEPRKFRSAVFKTTILPSPATHALLYDSATYRSLSGLIQTFLSDHIDSRLSLGWQLQHLKDANKWDVKNLAKWQAVKPVSEPIAGTFRAMKTLREVDDLHSPPIFVSAWKDRIKAVIDISHESPVYNPQTLNDGGIKYHKFPTVSKVPPTPEEVDDFILLVELLRKENVEEDKRLIGVHCHYGFNRTGFFICSYLIERKGYSVQKAIDEFQAQRPPGIRHEHFLDELFVRYCVGLRRVPAI